MVGFGGLIYCLENVSDRFINSSNNTSGLTRSLNCVLSVCDVLVASYFFIGLVWFNDFGWFFMGEN